MIDKNKIIKYLEYDGPLSRKKIYFLNDEEVYYLNKLINDNGTPYFFCILDY